MPRPNRSRAVGWLLAVLLSASGAAETANPETEQKAAFAAAVKAVIRGPAELPFGGQAKLQLPAGFVFIPVTEATRLMKSMGNFVDSDFQGLVIPKSNDHTLSFFDVSYHPAGYIKDDDAKDWDAAKMLDQMREGTAEGNKRRAAMGIRELEVTGWIQTPKYDSSAHQLVWSVGAREKGAPAGENDGVNYRTLVLGREGYVSMNLVTDQSHIDALRPAAAALLNALTFNDGKRYADFNASTDHVAEFGLAALIAGVAAKKLGLLALAVAFIVKFAKVIMVAVAALFLAFRKKLGLKKEAPAAPPQEALAAPPQAAQATPPQLAAPPQEPPAVPPPAVASPPGTA
jgi:uncharacterized membrane-anchored protein